MKRSLPQLALPLVSVPLLALAACQAPAATTTAPPATVTEGTSTESSAPESATSPTTADSGPSASTTPTATTPVTNSEEHCLATITGAIVCVDVPRGLTATKDTTPERTEQLVVTDGDGATVLTILSAPDAIGSGCGGGEGPKGEILASTPVALAGVKPNGGEAGKVYAVQGIGTPTPTTWSPELLLSSSSEAAAPGPVDYCTLSQKLLVFEDGGGLVARGPERSFDTREEAMAGLATEPYVSAALILSSIRSR